MKPKRYVRADDELAKRAHKAQEICKQFPLEYLVEELEYQQAIAPAGVSIHWARGGTKPARQRDGRLGADDSAAVE